MLRKQTVFFYILVNYCVIVCRTAPNTQEEKYDDGALLLDNNEYLVDKMLQGLADKRSNDGDTMKLYRKYVKDCDRNKIISAPLSSFLLNYESMPKLTIVQCKDSTTTVNKAVPGQSNKPKPPCPMKNMKPEAICEDGIMDPLEHGLLMIRNIRQHATVAIRNANELEMEIMTRCPIDQKQCHTTMS